MFSLHTVISKVKSCYSLTFDIFCLLTFQENYFGEDDMYMDFEEVISSPVLSLSTSSSSGWTAVGMENETSAKSIHPLSLRPWDITVLVNIYRVHGRLPVVSTHTKVGCEPQQAVETISHKLIYKLQI